MKNTHFYSFSSTFAQYFDTESILVVVVANFQLVLKKKLNTRKHCWPVLNFILSCTYTFKNLCLMNGLQMTIVLSCPHFVFFIFRQKEEAMRERSGTRMLRLPSWISTTSMSWKTGKKWWIHRMYIITGKITSTSTSCYCRSAWTTSIGFTNSLLELLYIEVSVWSWWLFCLFTVWESFGRLCFQQ